MSVWAGQMYHTGALWSLPHHLLFWGLSEAFICPLAKDRFPPSWYREIGCKNNVPFGSLCMKVRPVVVKKALASLVQVGGCSSLLKLRRSTSQLMSREKKLTFKKLSFSTINLGNTFPDPGSHRK